MGAHQTGQSAKTLQIEEWVRTYSKPLFAYAATRMNSSADAEDVVQETFLKAYRGLERFKPGSDAKSWLFQILINTIRDHFRRSVNRTATLAVEDVDETEIEMSALMAGPEEIAEQKELTVMLGEALARLPEQLAAPLMLREIGDRSYKEIAAALEIPIGTVMSRLSRARRVLATIIAPQLGREQATEEKLSEEGASTDKIDQIDRLSRIDRKTIE
ncbi:MAG: sigma-70 family RNA polymerase sigma factor [Cyanobacteria bacterium REEB67]|nr:sigma-70 family RNA polymerase sigma factor [Cyanobacteria bacterium REEB67]